MYCMHAGCMFASELFFSMGPHFAIVTYFILTNLQELHEWLPIEMNNIPSYTYKYFSWSLMLVSLFSLIPPLPKKSGCQIYFHFNDVTMRRNLKLEVCLENYMQFGRGKKIIYTYNDTTVSLYLPDLGIIDEVFIGRFNSLISFQLRMFAKSVEVVGCVMYITNNCNWCFVVFAGKHS